ncbi:MAG: ATP-binding protein [Chlorobiaceae bacterium]|nr:ATP-binding protein [Chlorobiaceae bacterium]
MAIIGPHGSGKTTLINKIKKEKNRPIFLSTKEVARYCQLNVGKKSDKKSQKWIIETQDYIEKAALSINLPLIFDRCLLDQYAYYRFWCGRDNLIEQMIAKNIVRYDCVVCLKANPNYLVDDGVRPVDIDFQKEIESIVIDNLSLFSVNCVNDGMSISQIYEFCIKTLNLYDSNKSINAEIEIQSVSEEYRMMLDVM